MPWWSLLKTYTCIFTTNSFLLAKVSVSGYDRVRLSEWWVAWSWKKGSGGVGRGGWKGWTIIQAKLVPYLLDTNAVQTFAGGMEELELNWNQTALAVASRSDLASKFATLNATSKIKSQFSPNVRFILFLFVVVSVFYVWQHYHSNISI